MAVIGVRPSPPANKVWKLRILKAILLVLVWVGVTAYTDAADETFALRNVEGRVLAVELDADSDEPQLRAAIELEAGETLNLEFAPAAICSEIGFAVHEGDLLRARIFVDGQGSGRVQNVRNVSRGTMIRLRTMHRIPLWDSTGRWYGGKIRTGPGPHRIRARGGSGRGGSR